MPTVGQLTGFSEGASGRWASEDIVGWEQPVYSPFYASSEDAIRCGSAHCDGTASISNAIFEMERRGVQKIRIPCGGHIGVQQCRRSFVVILGST